MRVVTVIPFLWIQSVKVIKFMEQRQFSKTRNVQVRGKFTNKVKVSKKILRPNRKCYTLMDLRN
jgi:hypothetical protein